MFTVITDKGQYDKSQVPSPVHCTNHLKYTCVVKTRLHVLNGKLALVEPKRENQFPRKTLYSSLGSSGQIAPDTWNCWVQHTGRKSSCNCRKKPIKALHTRNPIILNDTLCTKVLNMFWAGATKQTA